MWEVEGGSVQGLQTRRVSTLERRVLLRGLSLARMSSCCLALVILGLAAWPQSPPPVQAVPPTPQRPGDTFVNSKDGLTYVYIPPGTFQMGGLTLDRGCASYEKPRHVVMISKGFWMGRSEVTVGAYKKYCTATGRSMPEAPSFNPNWSEEEQPIVNVTWDAAAAYSQWVGGRLPTEAEWEYACRAGSETIYFWGNKMDGGYAWFNENSADRAHPVGQKKPNGWGLFDMVGNVWEWCSDWSDEHYYVDSPSLDPTGPATGAYRVLRGGSWSARPKALRSSHRRKPYPDFWFDFRGFRVVLPAGASTP